MFRKRSAITRLLYIFRAGSWRQSPQSLSSAFREVLSWRVGRARGYVIAAAETGAEAHAAARPGYAMLKRPASPRNSGVPGQGCGVRGAGARRCVACRPVLVGFSCCGGAGVAGCLLFSGMFSLAVID